MKKILIIVLSILSFSVSAQNLDEIIANYFENTGGKVNWEKLEGVKFIGNVKSGGMEIPFEMVQLKDGKQYVKISLQGKEMMQGVYDGEKLWSTNFMTMEAEEASSELTENFKANDAKNFPTPFLRYKENGYQAELIGEEVKEGTNCYKIKLTQNPIKADGKEKPSVAFYYFEKENFVPIIVESEMPSGPMKGQMMTISFGDYQEVEGLIFPFTMTQMGAPMVIETIQLNPKVDDSIFSMPAK